MYRKWRRRARRRSGGLEKRTRAGLNANGWRSPPLPPPGVGVCMWYCLPLAVCSCSRRCGSQSKAGGRSTVGIWLNQAGTRSCPLVSHGQTRWCVNALNHAAFCAPEQTLPMTALITVQNCMAEGEGWPHAMPCAGSGAAGETENCPPPLPFPLYSSKRCKREVCIAVLLSGDRRASV